VKLTRRDLLRAGMIAGAGVAIGLPELLASDGASAQQLDPATIPQFVTQLFVPPAMPAAAVARDYDRYSLAARPFRQQVLPRGFPATPVFGFGSTTDPRTFHSPGYTIEATADRQTRVTWANQLVDSSGDYVSSLLPIDPTLHWANPPGGDKGRDSVPTFKKTPSAYTGPVPLVVHLHGGHTYEDADGYPEAWYLPLARNIPKGYATVGSSYYRFKEEAYHRAGVSWATGMAQFAFDNDQRATNLWYHDHSLGIARITVRSGLLGMYMLRGGSGDLPGGVLPGPAPRRQDRPGTRHYEIPLVIQDPAFTTDGRQYLPPVNTFSSGPYIPETDIPPIWNGLFYGNTLTVNGNTWPNLNVEPRRYRFRVLNACAVRPLTLKVVSHPLATVPAEAALPIWVIGSDGGFLPAPVELSGRTGLPMLTAERYDIIVDFTGLKPGTHLYLTNEGSAATQGTTGSVLRFTVVPLASRDTSVPPRHLKLPKPPVLPAATRTRQVSFSEQASDFQLNVITQYLCGTVNSDGIPDALGWGDPVTEKPAHGATEVWEIWNFSPEGSAMISHVFHLHLVQFEVLNREPINGGAITGPNRWETGRKDSCAAPTGLVTRVKAHFDHQGTFVWHCHFLDHEDNNMMRPYVVT
jgi:spore coat protein A, manganese oxidase